jgi:hypothetical protein
VTYYSGSVEPWQQIPFGYVTDLSKELNFGHDQSVRSHPRSYTKLKECTLSSKTKNGQGNVHKCDLACIYTEIIIYKDVPGGPYQLLGNLPRISFLSVTVTEIQTAEIVRKKMKCSTLIRNQTIQYTRQNYSNCSVSSVGVYALLSMHQ